jgi:hypothetical protein
MMKDVLAALRSYSTELSNHHHNPDAPHFKDDIHYTLRQGRYHLVNPHAPEDLMDHLKGAAEGAHVLNLFHYGYQNWDGTSMQPGMNAEDSSTVANAWGVSNRAELLKRLTAGLPGNEDEHLKVEISDAASTYDYADFVSELENDPANREGHDEHGDFNNFSHKRVGYNGGAIISRSREIGTNEDGTHELETHYWDHPNGDWTEDEKITKLKPKVRSTVSNSQLGTLVRVIQPNDQDGGTEGYQELWSGGPTGENASSLIYQSNMEAYAAAGCNRVVVHAGLSVGGYAWARHGFDEESGDIDNFKSEIKDHLDRLHVDHGDGSSGSGSTREELPNGPAGMWEEHMPDDEAPDDYETRQDVETQAKNMNLSVNTADVLGSYHAHYAEGRHTDDEIGEHILHQAGLDSGQTHGMDDDDVKQQLSQYSRRLGAPMRGHATAVVTHNRGLANHENALKHLAQYPSVEERARKLREGRHPDSGIPQEDWDRVAEREIARDSGGLWQQQHNAAMDWSDPARVSPHPGEYTGPRPLSRGEEAAARQVWRDREGVGDDDDNIDSSNPFNAEALEDLKDDADNLSYMHEVAAFTLPKHLRSVLQGTGTSHLIGKEVLLGAGWHGQYPLDSGIRNPQVLAGNMYRAQKILARATSDLSGGTVTQGGGKTAAAGGGVTDLAAMRAERLAQTNPADGSGDVIRYRALRNAYFPGTDENEIAMKDEKQQRVLLGGGEMLDNDANTEAGIRHLQRVRARLAAAPPASLTPNWDALMPDLPIERATGDTHASMLGAINRYAPNASPDKQGAALNEWKYQMIGNPNVSSRQVYSAVVRTPPLSWDSARDLKASTREFVLPEVSDEGLSRIAGGWTDHVKGKVNGLQSEDIVKGRELIHKARGNMALDNLHTMNSSPQLGENEIDGNYTQGQRAVEAAWADQRGNHLVDGRGTYEQDAYEDAYGDLNSAVRSGFRAPVRMGQLTPEQLQTGAENARREGNDMPFWHPEFFKHLLTRQHRRRVINAGGTVDW